MQHKEFCPILLNQSNNWNSTCQPYCTCNKVQLTMPYCIAPSHTWEFLGNTSEYKWICKNCKLKSM